MDRIKGIIIKGIGGFYYVEVADSIYECKAKGSFRKDGITPLAGDMAVVELSETGYDSIVEICERKNSLIRPPIANIDNLFIVVATRKPEYSTLVIDRMIAIAENKGINPVIVINKCDLDAEAANTLNSVYSLSGFDTVMTSTLTGEGISELRPLLSGRINVFTGNTGVGKSSILNLIDSQLCLQTGKISEKLGRGRHTTRQTELFKLDNDTYIADTPGFSSLDIERYEIIPKEELQYCFREFSPYIGKCRFTSCSHVADRGCSIVEAVNEGKIARSRHLSYISMYNEVKNIKEYEMKNR